MVTDDLGASDAERDHVIELLQRAVGQGMLDLDEFSERTDAVLRARTRSEVNAVLFDLPAPVVDGNVARVLSRVLNMTEPVDAPTGRVILWDVAERLARCGQPRLVNNALMELGALICKPRNPACVLCPVRAACRAVDPDTLPRKRPRPTMEARVERYWWVYNGGRVLLQQRPPARRWALLCGSATARMP